MSGIFNEDGDLLPEFGGTPDDNQQEEPFDPNSLLPDQEHGLTEAEEKRIREIIVSALKMAFPENEIQVDFRKDGTAAIGGNLESDFVNLIDMAVEQGYQALRLVAIARANLAGAFLLAETSPRVRTLYANARIKDRVVAAIQAAHDATATIPALADEMDVLYQIGNDGSS